MAKKEEVILRLTDVGDLPKLNALIHDRPFRLSHARFDKGDGNYELVFGLEDSRQLTATKALSREYEVQQVEGRLVFGSVTEVEVFDKERIDTYLLNRITIEDGGRISIDTDLMSSV